MRLALRDLDTGMFYGVGSYWTDDPWFAQEFATPIEARTAAVALKIKNAELVFLSDCPLKVIGGTPIHEVERTCGT